MYIFYNILGNSVYFHKYSYAIIPIGFDTLKVICTQYEICSQVAIKNARTIFFAKLDGTNNSFRSDFKISQAGQKFPERAAPARI